MDSRITERLRQASDTDAGRTARGGAAPERDSRPAAREKGRNDTDGLRGSARERAREDDAGAPNAERWQRSVSRQKVRQHREASAEKKRLDEGGIPESFFEQEKVTDEDLEKNEETELGLETENEKKWNAAARIFNMTLIVACAYVIVLIFGVFMTDFTYNDEGIVAAQVLTVQDRKAKNAFETIQAQYENCRILYQKTLVLDYRVSQGVENPMTIAPEYEALLDDVTNLSIKVDALSVETQYTQVQSLLLTWIQDDIAVYLQNMAAGLSQNNEETLGNALVDAARVYSDFSIITQNIVALGEGLNGVDLTEAKQWTPEDYVEEYVNGE